MCSVHNYNHHTSSSSSTAVTTLTSGITATHDWFSRFLHTSQQNTYTLQWAALSPSKLPLPCRIWALSNARLLDPPKPQLKQHLDQFNRFCRAHNRDGLTDRPTDHATRSVSSLI